MVTSNDILQHAPLALYMLAVIGLSVNLAPLPRNGKSTTFILLAIGSLGITWKYMLDYMYRSFLDHLARAGIFQATTYRSTQWLQETSLFDEAWRYVCSTPDRWWFSSQLCLFTVGVFTVFLHAEGSRHPQLRGKVARFMILGQIVAISFASSLFLASLALTNVKTYTRGPSSLLRTAVLLAIGTVFLVPMTVKDKTFLPNLLVMHALITAPLLLVSNSRSSSPSHNVSKSGTQYRATSGYTYKTLYKTIAVISALLHIRHSLALWPMIQERGLGATIESLFADTLFVYPAQSSISFDVLCTMAIWQLWSVLEIYRLRKGRTALQIIAAVTCVGLVPTFGTAAEIAAFLAIREDWLAAESETHKAE